MLVADELVARTHGLDMPIYRQVLESARRARLPVVGHVVAEVGLERSIAAGQVSFEHAYDLHQRSRFASIVDLTYYDCAFAP